MTPCSKNANRIADVLSQSGFLKAFLMSTSNSNAVQRTGGIMTILLAKGSALEIPMTWLDF
jgi:ribosomal protein S8